MLLLWKKLFSLEETSFSSLHGLDCLLEIARIIQTLQQRKQ